MVDICSPYKDIILKCDAMRDSFSLLLLHSQQRICLAFSRVALYPALLHDPSTLPNASSPPNPLLRSLTRASHGSRAARIHRLPPSHELIAPVQFHLDRAPDLQRADGRPDAALAVQDPVIQALLRRRFEQFQKVAGRQVRHERQAGAGDRLVDQEPSDGCGEHA